jgi:hypothetical protein
MRSAFERCRLGDHMVSLDGFCWRCGYDLLGNGRTVVASRRARCTLNLSQGATQERGTFMNVDDAMALPAKRKPTLTDAVSLMLTRDRANRELVPDEFTEAVAPLDQMRQAATMALPSVAAIMSSAYEQACREAGGVGSAHAVETEGGALRCTGACSCPTAS